MNRYELNFDMIFSHNIVVSAKNKRESKKKATEKFLKKIKKSMFRIEHMRDTE